ncbi:hypothetical protein G6N74_05085 [Mesorhizobium sp. CGMCC 1.15528]|uniref:Uncharacterized protein n=1 Tax=Mesorhizobium zhangyense TaxID=1776730 RepID=A0A7C9VAE7_9HYPH|nr:hypothetical protein [Mesorhizobium zhangyense]NGN40430.1 hypothetical protein [Mesorhizobium zhangyense]
MKFLSFVRALFEPATGQPAHDDVAVWVRDPLAHPVLEAMSERELGDLPFNRGYQSLRNRSAACGTCG